MTELYQHGTLGALMAGMMQGTTAIGELLEYGDFGIGTLHGLDGEVVILNGEAYQGRSDGALIKLTGSELTPYAAVTKFAADQSFAVRNLESEAVKQLLLEKLPSHNLFGGVKLSGTFEKMHIRIMPKQEPPYQRLVEVSKNQPEFTAENIRGTIVGFYTPALFQGVAAAGFHLHFIDDARKFGGHILDFTVAEAEAEVMKITDFTQHLPEDPTFLASEIDYADLASEIDQAES